MTYHQWLDAFAGPGSTPQTYAYTFGNPLLAQRMLKHDLTVALRVPPKLVIIEKPDGSGTVVTYDDPASVMVVPSAPGQEVHSELIEAAGLGSRKFETLVRAITRVD